MPASQFFDQQTRQPGAYPANGNYFDRFTQPRRRPIGGSPAFNAAPTNTGYDGRAFADNPQLGGLAAGVNAIHDQNVAIANRPQGPSYIQRQMAGYGGGRQQQGPMAQSGTMPWSWLGNQYAPMNQSPLAMAPTNMTQYGAQMHMQNPGGHFFGGAIPAYGTSSGGQTRPMFMGAPHDFGPQGNFQLGSDKKYMQGPNGQIIHGGVWSSKDQDAMQAASQMFDARGGGLAQRQQDYQGRMAMRRAGIGQNAGVQANSIARSDARRMRTGNLSMGEQAMFGIPGYANQQLQNQNSQGWMQHQAGMFQQKQQADMHNGYMDRMAQLAGAIPGMGLPPGVQQGYMDRIMQSFGMPGQPAGGQPTGTGAQRANYYLTPQQQGQLRGMKPAEREAKLNEWGITDTVTRQHLLGVNGMSDPATGNMMTDLGNSFWGGIGRWFAGGPDSAGYAHPTLVPTPAGKDGKRGVKPRTPYRPMFPTPAAPGMPEFAGPMF